MRNSLVVANRFLALAGARGDSLTPMQVLKLVYIAHGWMLGLHGRPLISDDVEAWQYGPVIPKLYNRLRRYKAQPVTEQISLGAGDDSLDATDLDVIRKVYDLYGKKTGIQLSRMTHAQGTPWAKSYEPDQFGCIIPTDLIEDHYRRLAEAAAEKQPA